MSRVEDKTCAVCGRRIAWRKKWEQNWDEIRYCSQRCRRNRLGPTDHALEEAIRALLAQRKSGATICPSEAARAVWSEQPGGPGDGGDAGHAADADGWRALMEPARQAARRMVAEGEVEITQKGRVVDPSTAKGPIRIRMAR